MLTFGCRTRSDAPSAPAAAASSASGASSGGGAAPSSPPPIPPPSPGAVRVMPLGDSITDGYQHPGGYRLPLAARARAEGLSIDFVGGEQNGPPELGDREHEGHSGWHVDELRHELTRWVGANRPAVVLLMIGTNDVAHGRSAVATATKIASLVDELYALVPDVGLALASITPFGDAVLDESARALAPAVSAIAEAHRAKGRRAIFVDMHAALAAADLEDGVHPNQEGYRKMAEAWLPALRTLAGKAP